MAFIGQLEVFFLSLAKIQILYYIGNQFVIKFYSFYDSPYIPGGVAHRVANIGYSVLSFAACWPSDAGHDYQVILENGFSASLQCVNGNPQLIEI